MRGLSRVRFVHVVALLAVTGLLLGGFLIAKEAWLELALLVGVLCSVLAACLYLRSQFTVFQRDFRTLETLPSKVERLERRVTTIDNTAASVGRAAPIIRAIDANVRALLGDTGTPAVPVNGNGTATAPASLPPAEPTDGPPTFGHVRALMVADEFTVQSFAHEWQVELPTPDDWEELLDKGPVDLLFVESAWNGNNGAWLYHLVGPSAPRPALVGLVSACRERGIPTIFWNKEDPPHFEDFLETAKLFDWVATTDGDLLDEYRQRLGHDRVFLLPFAAQHRLHNPVRQGEGHRRIRNIVFGGMYFRHKYPERRQQMETLLPAAAKLGLDIYTRHADKPEYAYPQELQAHVRGTLSYPEMVSAYKAYRVVVNVNSVVTSSTMCARRIFEATACGAAVVTMPTKALLHYFDDEQLTIVEDEREAYDAMRLMLRSPETRERQVHAAQRRIWTQHTYSHRAATVMQHLGLPVPGNWLEPPVSVICSTNRPANFRMILENFTRQAYPNKQLLIATHGFEVQKEQLRRMLEEVGLAHAPTIVDTDREETLGDNLNRLIGMADGQYLCRFDDDDFYGAQYVLDSVLAQRYSGADLVGKEASYHYFEGLDATYLIYPQREHVWTDFLRGPTFSGPKETFDRVRFAAATRGEDSDFLARVKVEGGRIYAADRFNFVANRRADHDSHTWNATDRHIASTGVMCAVGDGRQLASV
jgi:hypothetical protein